MAWNDKKWHKHDKQIANTWRINDIKWRKRGKTWLNSCKEVSFGRSRRPKPCKPEKDQKWQGYYKQQTNWKRMTKKHEKTRKNDKQHDNRIKWQQWYHLARNCAAEALLRNHHQILNQPLQSSPRIVTSSQCLWRALRSHLNTSLQWFRVWACRRNSHVISKVYSEKMWRVHKKQGLEWKMLTLLFLLWKWCFFPSCNFPHLVPWHSSRLKAWRCWWIQN